jgi:hypothetical protein
LQVFQMHVSNISFVFFCMLQVLHLDISKVDQVLMRVGSRRGHERSLHAVWQRGRHPGQRERRSRRRGPVAWALARSLCGHHPTLMLRIRRPGASKSAIIRLAPCNLINAIG